MRIQERFVQMKLVPICREKIYLFTVGQREHKGLISFIYGTLLNI